MSSALGRPATRMRGKWNDKRQAWGVRLTLKGQPRKTYWVKSPNCLHPPAATDCACANCEAAEVAARDYAAHMRTTRAVVPAKVIGDTVSEWYGRYFKAAAKRKVGRTNKGREQAAVEGRRSRFKIWIEPTIGKLGMSAVTS